MKPAPLAWQCSPFLPPAFLLCSLHQGAEPSCVSRAAITAYHWALAAVSLGQGEHPSTGQQAARQGHTQKWDEGMGRVGSQDAVPAACDTYGSTGNGSLAASASSFCSRAWRRLGKCHSIKNKPFCALTELHSLPAGSSLFLLKQLGKYSTPERTAPRPKHIHVPSPLSLKPNIHLTLLAKADSNWEKRSDREAM